MVNMPTQNISLKWMRPMSLGRSNTKRCNKTGNLYNMMHPNSTTSWNFLVKCGQTNLEIDFYICPNPLLLIFKMFKARPPSIATGMATDYQYPTELSNFKIRFSQYTNPKKFSKTLQVS